MQTPRRLAALDDALDAGDRAAARRAPAALGGEDDDDPFGALATRAAAGSALATELLVEHLDGDGIVRRFVGGVLLDDHAVDDVTQDTLISVARSIGSYEGRSRFTTWLYALANRRCADHLRRQRDERELGDLDPSESVRMSSMIATRESVRAVVDGLPDAYRRAVALRDIEGLSYQEAADRLDLNLNTLKTHVARGRALVAARLEQGAP